MGGAGGHSDILQIEISRFSTCQSGGKTKRSNHDDGRFSRSWIQFRVGLLYGALIGIEQNLEEDRGRLKS